MMPIGMINASENAVQPILSKIDGKKKEIWKKIRLIEIKLRVEYDSR